MKPTKKVRLSGWLVAMILLAGCGDGDNVIDGPGDDEDTSSSTSTSTLTPPSSSESTSTSTSESITTTEDQEEDEDEFSFDLPSGDDSIGTPQEMGLYLPLEKGRCDEAQAGLDRYWHDLVSPRNVLLYQAAVHFCAGRTATGKAVFMEADGKFGWTGVASPPLDCNVYKAARSVVDQRPQESIPCPEGEFPKWQQDGRSTPRDDPRTPTDESQNPTTTTSSSDTTTSTTEP